MLTDDDYRILSFFIKTILVMLLFVGAGWWLTTDIKNPRLKILLRAADIAFF